MIESYVNTAAAFFNWFVEEIGRRYAKEKNEYLTTAEEFKEWYEEGTGMNTEGYRSSFRRPPQATEPAAASDRSRSG